MIQISNPIQLNNPQTDSVNLDNNRPEAAGDMRSIFQGSQKKNRLGVFAKLLEGLSAKLTRGTGESGDSEIDESSGAGKGANRLSNAKKTQNSSIGTNFPGIDFSGAEIPNAKKADAGFLIPGHEADAVMASKTGEILPWEMESREANPREIKAQDIKSREAKSKEYFHFLSSLIEKDEEGENSVAETLKGIIGNEGEKQGQTGISAEKTKNARNYNTLNVSFREIEAEALKNQTWAHLAGMNSGQKAQGAGTENGLAEPRGKKGRERLNIEVRDLRTGNLQRGMAASPESGGASKEVTLTNVKLSGAAEIEIPVDLNSSMAREKAAGEASNPSPQGRTFEDLLAAQLRGDLSTDIVRDASVIVRNGGEGTIRLSLRPASLGDVKIHLEMAENKITGHIIVESDEALRAFQRELPVLEKAFRDSGYSETSLDMSLAQNGDSGSHGQRQEGNFLSHSLAASRYDSESYRYGTEPEAPISGAPVGGVALPTLPGRTPVYLLV